MQIYSAIQKVSKEGLSVRNYFLEINTKDFCEMKIMLGFEIKDVLLYIVFICIYVYILNICKFSVVYLKKNNSHFP